MIQFLKKFFIPTEQNGMIPLGLWSETSLFYLIIALIIILSPSFSRVSEFSSLVNTNLSYFSPQKVIALINQSRVAFGLHQLKENPKLDQAAELKTDDMFSKNYFSHFSPTNKNPWDFFREVGYNFYAAGENLAINFISPEETHKALMDSPTHRANILNPLYDEIGISVKQGVFEGQPSIIVTQYFGKLSPKTGILKTKTINSNQKKNIIPTISYKKASILTKFLPAEIEIELVAILVIFLLLISTMFLITRGGILSTTVIARTAVLVLIFGYIVFFGTSPKSISRITPSSASTTMEIHN